MVVPPPQPALRGGAAGRTQADAGGGFGRAEQARFGASLDGGNGLLLGLVGLQGRGGGPRCHQLFGANRISTAATFYTAGPLRRNEEHDEEPARESPGGD